MFRRLGMALCALALLSVFPRQGWGETLNIGVLPAADSLVLHVAADEGLFAARGLDVKLVPFQSALELGAAMRAGALAGHFGDIPNVLMQRENGADQAIVVTTTRAHPGQRHFGLAVSPASRATSPADLKGADTAVSSATIIDFLLDCLLEQEGLPADFLRRQDIRQIPVRLQMLMAGRLESALLPEPLVSLVEARGARVLLDDRGLDVPLAVIALRRPWTGPDVAGPFRAALEEAARRMDADPERYRRVMAEKGLLPRGAEDRYEMLRFGDGERALPALPTEDDIRRFVVWMRSRGMLKTDPAFADVVIP